MVPTVRIPTYVSHPHIKPLLSQDVGKALGLQVGEPVRAGAEEAVLEEHDRSGNVGCMRDQNEGRV